MRSYLTDCMQKQVPASFDGYNTYVQGAIKNNKQLSLSAKAGKVALKGLAMAGNAVVGALAGIALNFAITKLSDLANKEEIAAEKAEAFSSTLTNFQNSISEGSKKIEELSEKYDNLSDGVSATGMNISLTDEEYSEYKNTISELSELMPNLTALFNEQGEKIGFAGGKIQDATEKYKEYIKIQAQDYLRRGDGENTVQDILDDYKYSNETTTYGWSNAWRDYIDTAAKTVPFGMFGSIVDKVSGNTLLGDFGSEIFGAEAEFSVREQLDILEDLLNSSKDKWRDILNDSLIGDSKQANLVEDLLGIDVDKVSDMTDDDFNHIQKSLSQKINSLQQMLEGEAREINSVMQEMLLADDNYWEID